MDVNAQVMRRAQCLVTGHELSRSAGACRNCGAAEATVMTDAGAVPADGSWLFLPASTAAQPDITFIP